MPIPNKAIGYGNNSIAQNVFMLTYSTALSSPPQWEAYDTNATFPAIDNLSTTLGPIFTGTVDNGGIPMLSLVATTTTPPTSAWKPASPIAGSATANRMRGQTSYVVDPTTPGDGGSIKWNMVLEVPSDVGVTTLSHTLLNRYTFTGAPPSLTWAFNDASSGTELSPLWTTFTPSTHGIRHCRIGTVAGGPYLLSVPASGLIDAAEAWITP